MLCLNSKYVFSPSRFLVNGNRDRLVVRARCGKCANCLQSKHAEWYFRAYHHFKNAVEHGRYVLFDCLTYAPEYVPRFRDIEEFKVLPPSQDYMCFRSEDLCLFHKRLRKALVKRGFKKNAYSYFCASEYGESENRTHRPHYHILFFINGDIDPLIFSRLVADSWWYGRTDGLPYKPVAYVKSNVFRSMCVGGRRVCQYVSKYVMKDSAYSRQVEKRIYKVIFSLCNGNVDAMQSPKMRDYARALRRKVCQFHRQSCSFGLSALDGVDESELFERGFFMMPNGKATSLTRIPIGTYFLRKIAYELVTLPDGYKAWSVRPGKAYLLDLRSANMVRLLSQSLKASALSYGLSQDIDFHILADYALNSQGRSKGISQDIFTIQERLKYCDRFVYASTADKNHYGLRFVADRYYGYNGHYLPIDGSVVPLREYIESELIHMPDYDKYLAELEKKGSCCAQAKQDAFDTIQRVNHISKILFPQ